MSHKKLTLDVENIFRLSTNRELHNYKYVFILGQLLHGIGASALTTLGTTLLVKEQRT